MTSNIDLDTMRRLALVRLLLSRAEQEAWLAPPFSADSVNRLHDVAEMFLALAAQRNNVTIPGSFMGYWDTLEKPLGRPLAYRAPMQKFNKLRVNLKHYGIQPHEAEVSAARAAVRGLIEDESPQLFGIALSDVSLSLFVSDSKARELLDRASDTWEQGEQGEAFADLSDAFERVIEDYEARKQVSHRRSVFDTTKDMSFLSPFFRRVEDREQSEFEEAVIESLNALDFQIKLVGLGVDLRRYGKFKALVPTVTKMMDGHRHVHDREYIRRSQEDYEFCRDFVIATAVHLAEFDYEFDYWADWQDYRSKEPPDGDHTGGVSSS